MCIRDRGDGQGLADELRGEVLFPALLAKARGLAAGVHGQRGDGAVVQGSSHSHVAGEALHGRGLALARGRGASILGGAGAGSGVFVGRFASGEGDGAGDGVLVGSCEADESWSKWD